MKKLLSIFIFICLSARFYGQQTKLFHPERIPLFVTYIEGVNDENKTISGSGLFIGEGNCFYILTAAHVVRPIVNKEMIALDFNGKGLKRRIDLREIKASRWIFHETADLALLKLNSNIGAQLKQTGRYFPINQIYSDTLSFSRINEVYVYGFPFFLEDNAIHFSASILRTFFSTGFIDLKREDTSEKILNTFQILQSPSMDGYSGGPVFNLDATYGRGLQVSGKSTQLLGIVHGTLRDATGGKAAAVIPSFYIIDLLNKVKCE